MRLLRGLVQHSKGKDCYLHKGMRKGRKHGKLNFRCGDCNKWFHTRPARRKRRLDHERNDKSTRPIGL